MRQDQGASILFAEADEEMTACHSERKAIATSEVKEYQPTPAR